MPASSCLYVAANSTISFFFMAAYYSIVYTCVCVCVYTHTHTHFMHSSGNGHFRLCLCLAIVNSTAMNIGVVVFRLLNHV